jgi:hypothetical protein
MTNEQINIAIAEASGWIKTYEEGEDEGCGKWFWHRGNQNLKQPPNYCNDLNAIHEAEKILTADQFEQYRWILWDICKQFRVKDWYRCYLSSTARQRAEAFLKTLGKWEGAK